MIEIALCTKMFRILSLAIVALFAGYLHAQSWDFSSYEEYDFYDFYDFNDTCKAAGLLCKSCSELVQCVETTPGNFVTIPIQTCDIGSGITCLNKKCSNETNPRCNNQTVPDFVCSNTGIFPDPYDCQRYHMCAMPIDNIESTAPAQQIDLKCLGNFGYDPVTTYCKTPLTNGVCPDSPPIPACKTPGESAAVGTTSIYYICLVVDKVLLPHLYMCPNGKKYVNYKCI